jgi:hypothetical protein
MGAGSAASRRGPDPEEGWPGSHPRPRVVRGRRLPGLTLLSILAVLVAETGCREGPGSADPAVVATVGGLRITVSDLEAEVRRQPAAGLADPETRRQRALDALVDEASLFCRAADAGFDQSPEMQIRWRRMVARGWRERTLAKGSADPISEADIESWYLTQRDRFRLPGRIRASLIALHVSSRAEPAKREAARRRLSEVHDAILAATNQPVAFARHARELSDDAATRYHDGDIGWLVLGRTPLRWPEEVGRALAATTEAGPLSSVLETPPAITSSRFGNASRPPTAPWPRSGMPSSRISAGPARRPGNARSSPRLVGRPACSSSPRPWPASESRPPPRPRRPRRSPPPLPRGPTVHALPPSPP